MPVIFNGVIIGLELAYVSAIPAGISVAATMFYIGLGEFISVSILGILIAKLVFKNETIKAYLTDW